MTKLDIIVPCYNSNKYINRCLDSIFNQTFKDFTVIVNDDGSTDNTYEILLSYSKKYKNMIVIKNKGNKGTSYTKNKALDISKNEYVLFVDSDDYLDNDYLEKVFNSIDSNADVVETINIHDYIKKNKTIFFTEIKLYKENKTYTQKAFKNFLFLRYSTGVFYKRKIISNLRFNTNIKCYEDSLFNNLLKNNINLFQINKTNGYHYVLRKKSLSSITSKNHLDYIKVSKEISDYYKKTNYLNNNIKSLVVEKLLFSNIFFILISKIGRNSLSKNEKKQYINQFINLIIDVCPIWILKHPILFKFIKSKLMINFYLNNKIKFDKLLFEYFAITNKYKIRQ